MDKKEDIKVLKSGYELRTVRSDEADQAAHIEEACFPHNEACSAEQIKKRVATASELFLVAVDMSTGKLAGFLNGLATDEESFRDEFFKDAGMNDPKGKNIMLLGLDVYVEKERKNGRKKLILTCLDHLVEMYKKMGYTDLGEANSTWGGEKWHEMIYILNE